MLSTAKVAKAILQSDIASGTILRPDDIAKPQLDLLPAILSRFFASFVEVLSALINYLLEREEKLNLLRPIINKVPDYHECSVEPEARIDQFFTVQSLCSVSVRGNAHMQT
ncbi:hypothetical protein QYE76_060132 [Lolium multiflorum]|uniref:Uncharacterized protein n=1 Tax=Lolium multiflorum TaxID=4521 RepID=A0AAD8S1L3_LOLMU|nr:hypothetical protein QYE76_060132 [Lolium multiflorum]